LRAKSNQYLILIEFDLHCTLSKNSSFSQDVDPQTTSSCLMATSMRGERVMLTARAPHIYTAQEKLPKSNLTLCQIHDRLISIWNEI
jgi:hypothetical protein